jgi:hypothetical protein
MNNDIYNEDFEKHMDIFFHKYSLLNLIKKYDEIFNIDIKNNIKISENSYQHPKSILIKDKDEKIYKSDDFKNTRNKIVSLQTLKIFDQLSKPQQTNRYTWSTFSKFNTKCDDIIFKKAGYKTVRKK